MTEPDASTAPSDEADEAAAGESSAGRGWKFGLLICSLILILAGGLSYLIFSTEPAATRQAASKQTAMLVEVTRPEQGTFRPTIVAMGTVAPEKDIVLSPRVSGEIVERSAAFTPGGTVRKGEMLLQIDPADYENTLKQRKSDLQRAVADLNLEMGRQAVAETDYELLDEGLSPENKALVLRKPQLQSARAGVAAARAALSQARLDLERTTVKAPFDAHILTRNVNTGSQAAPGDDLARLVGTDTYWVAATVPLSKLRWLKFPEEEGAEKAAGSRVRVRNRTAWPEGVYRSGRLYKRVGTLEEKTRMARVLVSVPDPFARAPASQGLPPLMIGAFVEARIQGRPISDAVRLNRDYIRKNDTVWVMKKGRLAIQKVEIILQDADFAYIRSGLTAADPVVTTNLTTVVSGAPLRLKDGPS